MGSVVDDIRSAVARVIARANQIPGLLQTEADAQAELHAELLIHDRATEMSPGIGLLQHPHHKWPMTGAWAYREISAGPSRETPRADVTLLGEVATLEPKDSGAPARFKGPVSALIELKFDVGRVRSAPIGQAIRRDFTKWEDQVRSGAAQHALAVIFTDRPQDYDFILDEGILVAALRQAPPRWMVDAREAEKALDEAIAIVSQLHRTNPLAMLREKDFETRILRRLRDFFGERAGQVRSQARVRCASTGRLRPLDVSIMSGQSQQIAAALEIKTSHSLRFRTLGRTQLEDEADFLADLINSGTCAAAKVAVFRYGSRPDCDAIESWRMRRSNLPLIYSEC